ncbi:MAG: 4Fe-4S dicluster domain-containing protein [Chloroflexota bacterium]|nr:4Fe-4S dicluster domain-containing protein [Dehalococcoidia bacterium]MDW8254864.1 4Fe-4S dicluster domain-containing protein [Chloroflexota bacterium]
MFGSGLLLGLATTLRTALRRPVTIQYPEERRELSPRTHGAPGLIWDNEADEPKCTGCGLCMRECPVGVIHLTSVNNPKFKRGSTRKRIVEDFTIDLYRCIYCAICVDVCPFEAIEMTPVFELARYNKGQVVASFDDLVEFTGTRRPDSTWSPHAAPAPVGAKE